MILHNARVLTMDDSLPHCSALAIAGGRVLGGVDSREDVIASHAHERIDLQGAAVVPGFVDAHVHFRGWAEVQAQLDLRGEHSLESMLTRVREHASTLGADEWVRGRGWDDDAVRGAATAPAALLSEAAGHRPAALVSHDGHALWLNDRALREVGFTVDDMRVDGGLVDSLHDGGFSGVLRERSAWHVRNTLPSGTDTRDLARAMRAASAAGVTAVHDFDGMRALGAWHRLDEERGLTFRVWQHFLADELHHLAALGLWQNFGSERVRLGGIKLFADGTLSSGTAWLHEPERANGAGAAREQVVLADSDEIARITSAAARAGFAVSVHAIGDAAVSAALDAFERTQAEWSGHRVAPRIEHAQLMRSADMDRAAELGVTLSVQPGHLLSDRQTAEVRWGERCGHAYAYNSMMQAGCDVVFGSDAPIEPLDPMGSVRAAVTRAGADGESWNPQQCVSVEQALYASTAACADAAGMTGTYGRLTPGHVADLVVLSDDPLTTGVDDVSVVATMVGGAWVHGRSNL